MSRPKRKQKNVAVYVRVSTVSQNEEGQWAAIERWLNGNGINAKHVRWFIDKKTGDNTNRPTFKALQTAIFNGEVQTVVLYKLDRLSRKPGTMKAKPQRATKLMHQGLSQSEIAKALGVSRATVQRYLNRVNATK